MDDIPALAPLVDGEYPVLFTDENYDALERERIRAAMSESQRHDEIIARLDTMDRDLQHVLDVIATLEGIIAKLAPSLDELSANPAKFLMSMMGGGKNGGR